jgi:hypothetical protein
LETKFSLPLSLPDIYIGGSGLCIRARRCIRGILPLRGLGGEGIICKPSQICIDCREHSSHFNMTIQ